MRYAVKLPQVGTNLNGRDILRFAQGAERMGFDILSVGDHVVFPERITTAYPYATTGRHPSESAPNYVEAMTLLSYVAGATSTIKLLTGVLIVPYRHPVLVAKMIASLDYLTQGRVIFGIGVGWMKEEFEVLGFSYEHRGALTDEMVEIYKTLWTQERPAFKGRFFQFDELRFSPKPVQKPHPPIWIGGNTRLAMRRAARGAQGWFPVHMSSDEMQPMIQELRAMTVEAGRKPGEIEVCLGSSLEFADRPVTPDISRRLFGDGDPRRMIAELRALADMGVGAVHFDFRTRDVSARLELMERFMAEVRPHAS